MDVKSASSLSEFFREAVSSAMRNQSLATTELTEFYLVNLLSEFAHAQVSDEALALKMCDGLEAMPGTRAQKLKEIGDTSLFVSGFFPDSLNGSLVDVDYYIGMGEVAYGHLSRMGRGVQVDSLSQVFCELSGKFARFVEVLSEIASDSAVGASADLLRMYEKYVKTGSPAVLAKLQRRGMLLKTGTVH
jgi:hypothetical protein